MKTIVLVILAVVFACPEDEPAFQYKAWNITDQETGYVNSWTPLLVGDTIYIDCEQKR